MKAYSGGDKNAKAGAILDTIFPMMGLGGFATMGAKKPTYDDIGSIPGADSSLNYMKQKLIAGNQVSGIDSNLFNRFQSNIPGQTVSNINLAQSVNNNAARQGGLASGVLVKLNRLATQEELAKAALQHIQAWQGFQDMDAAQRMKMANQNQQGLQSAYSTAAGYDLGQRKMELDRLMQNPDFQYMLNTGLAASQQANSAAKGAGLGGILGSIGGILGSIGG
jgi:hypothetical protein